MSLVNHVSTRLRSKVYSRSPNRYSYNLLFLHFIGQLDYNLKMSGGLHSLATVMKRCVPSTESPKSPSYIYGSLNPILASFVGLRLRPPDSKISQTSNLAEVAERYQMLLPAHMQHLHQQRLYIHHLHHRPRLLHQNLSQHLRKTHPASLHMTSLLLMVNLNRS